MFNFSPLGVIYNNLKSSSSVWLAQLGSALWVSIQAEYSMENALESTDDSIDEFVLAIVDLFLGASICISLETSLDSAGLDMTKVVVKRFVFAIFLLGATIHNGSMRERSDVFAVTKSYRDAV